MPLTSKYLEVNFGTAYTGLGTVGYELVNNAGGTVVARTTTGVFEIQAGSGAYGVVVPTIADSVASVVWDTGGGSPVYATEDIDPYHKRENLDALISSRATPADITTAETNILNAIAALNDISIADVQTALDNQGYTAARAALLDNLDQAISSLNDLSIADVQTALDNQGYTAVRAALLDNLDGAISTVLLAIGALNDLSQADVQTAMTAQGYTTVRAALIDNLDAAITTVLAAIAALNDLSQADVQSALTAQGYTTVRAALIDNLDAPITNVTADTLKIISLLGLNMRIFNTVLDGQGNLVSQTMRGYPTKADAQADTNHIIEIFFTGTVAGAFQSTLTGLAP